MKLTTKWMNAKRKCMWLGCGNIATETHHIIPKSQNGNSSEENLICLCHAHHCGDWKLNSKCKDWYPIFQLFKFIAINQIEFKNFAELDGKFFTENKNGN